MSVGAGRRFERVRYEKRDHSPDSIEAVRAFTENRDPVWTGR
ncbi:hypothetical protein [Sinosporangium siamense]|nr:hypothetical protein [Sinosporangium siamense]